MPQMRRKYDPVFRDRDCAGFLKRRRSRWLQSLVNWVPTMGTPLHRTLDTRYLVRGPGPRGCWSLGLV